MFALAAAVALATADQPRGIPIGWRNVASQPQTITLGEHEIRYRFTRNGLETDEDVELVSATPRDVVFDVAGVRRHCAVARYGDLVHVDTADAGARFTITPRFLDPAEQVAPGSLIAPMPGSVVRIAVEVGDRVTAGQPVLWLEAMKMQHQISAPADGVLTELFVQAGNQIDVGTVLAVVDPL